MKLKEVFVLKEDASSAADRGHAADVFHRLMDVLRAKKHAPLLTVKKGHDALEAFFDIGKALKDQNLNGLVLSFDLIDNRSPTFAEDTQAMFSPPGGSVKGQGIITLYIRNIEGTRVSAEKWKQYVTLNASKLFNDLREFFVHEFIHYLDEKREGFDDYYADGDEQYHNDPREITAYLQQTFTQVEDLLLSGGGKAILAAAEQGTEQFKKVLLKKVSGVRHLRPENLKKVEGKVEEFRKYILDKYGE